MSELPNGAIVIRGARQNNLRNLTLELPLNELIVVSGVSGSGKSSLVFDTLYAEGQRRYVETFSPYARQFLDRMDKPLVDAIEGIPPAIAIDQTNPVRTSRSTVGTMTELNDHLKLLFARAARLFCRGCGAPVRRDTPDTMHADLAARAGAAGDPRLVITFPVAVPKNFSEGEVKELLQRQGYTRIHAQRDGLLEVVQDRVRMSSTERARVIEALEAAFRVGQGRVNVYPVADGDGGHPSTAASETTSQEIGHTMSAALRATGGQIPEQVRGPSSAPRRAPIPRQRVAFHSPCTLQHGLKLQGAVEKLLGDLGYALSPVPDAHLCCGSAGTYSILQPELSQRLLKNKIAALESGAPSAIVTANIGCQAHLQTATTLSVRHWIEALDDSLSSLSQSG